MGIVVIGPVFIDIKGYPLSTYIPGGRNSGDVVAAISKRPNLDEIINILDEQGDEIFRDCDSISLEVDMDKRIVKRVFEYAKKYNKKVYGVISNMSIAQERRDFFKSIACLVCNLSEMEILFGESYEGLGPDEVAKVLLTKTENAEIPSMIVTMGSAGACWADSINHQCGNVAALKVDVKDTTGAGDAFFAGACIGLTYGKSFQESCMIGTKLAASVIPTTQNVCPRFLPGEFGIEI